LVAFAGSLALWWIYFQRSADAGAQILASTADPGRLARSAYSYIHPLMVAGIIAVAAADELTVAHPLDHGAPASVGLSLGGTALFVGGHALFKYAVFEEPPWSHIIAMLALAVLVPVGLSTSTLLLNAAASVVLVGLAAWETVNPRGRGPSTTNP
jgi:low temperature requirement protein LtrA